MTQRFQFSLRDLLAIACIAGDSDEAELCIAIFYTPPNQSGRLRELKRRLVERRWLGFYRFVVQIGPVEAPGRYDLRLSTATSGEHQLSIGDLNLPKHTGPIAFPGFPEF